MEREDKSSHIYTYIFPTHTIRLTVKNLKDHVHYKQALRDFQTETHIIKSEKRFNFKMNPIRSTHGAYNTIFLYARAVFDFSSLVTLSNP